MKRRIFCLILCLIMVVPMLASCGSEEEEEEIVETSSREAVTLSMYVITEKETTPAASQAVEDAINKLIKAKYTTKLEITFLTADEYYSKAEAQIAGMKSGAASLPAEDETDTGDESEALTTEATVVNEYGVKELKYPDLTPSQIDILMIDDYSKYLEYAQKGWLYSLNDTLKNTSKKLGDYIYPTILETTNVGGITYAVPTNMPIGDTCTYMIIDRDLADEYGLELALDSSIYDCADFFAWVKENKTDVTPIAGQYNKIGATYVNVDSAKRAFTNNFSLVGKYGYSSSAEAEYLLANENYRSELLSNAKYRFEGYFGAEIAENFAAKIKTGTLEEAARDAENYEVIVLEGEYKTGEELCRSMFAVTRYTQNFNRAMEIITLLNTNSEFRNLLQYGIENVNYVIDAETGALSRLNSEYMMDIYKTGNVFMAYPEEEMPAEIWNVAKKLNLASIGYDVDSYVSFEIPDDKAASEGESEGFTVDFTSSRALADASSELKAALDGCGTYEEYSKTLNEAVEKYASVASEFLSTSNENTPYALYVSEGN